MWNSAILFLNQVIEKWLRYYRLCVFRAKTGQKANGCMILGRITIINPNVTVGDNVVFYPNVMLFGNGPISIGNNVAIGNNSVVYAHSTGGIEIGDYSMIAANCYLIDSNHGIKKDRLISEQNIITQKTRIGQDVWIGAGCQIIKGAEIEDGAVIGAGSMVNKHIPANAIAFGSPAKVHKFRE